MASDKKNIEVFNQTANDPDLWRLRGLDLSTAAEVLRQKALESMRKPDWSNLSLSDPGVAECFKYAGLLFQAAMLQGFAVECLLKCFWIVQGNSVAEDGEYKIETIKRENHDLVQIAAAVGFSISTDESGALAKLSGFAKSIGRYPIAKKWQDQPLVKNEFGIDACPSWTNEDHALAETVLARLKSEIDPRRQAKGTGSGSSHWSGHLFVITHGDGSHHLGVVLPPDEVLDGSRVVAYEASGPFLPLGFPATTPVADPAAWIEERRRQGFVFTTPDQGG